MDPKLLKKRFQKARLPGADFRKQFGQQWTKRDKPYFSMRFTLRLGFAVLILLVLPFGYLQFSNVPFGDDLAQQFLAQAEEVYRQNPSVILYEKMEILSTFNGNEFDQIGETWLAPDGSSLWRSLSTDGEDNEMSGITLALVDDRGVMSTYLDDYAGLPPTENPYCIFVDEDVDHYYRMEMEMDGSSQPGFGGYVMNKNADTGNLSARDSFFLAFQEGENSNEKGKRIIENLQGNSDWDFTEEDRGYVFSNQDTFGSIEVVFDQVTYKIVEITVAQDADVNTTRYLEQKELPLEDYDSIFDPEVYGLKLADVGPLVTSQDLEQGCYSILGERLSDEESAALLGTLKKGYIEESLEEFKNPF